MFGSRPCWPGRAGDRARPLRRLLPDADQGLPRHLGRPAARGRGRRDRRRGRQRRARRQGVRPGGARAPPDGRRRPQTLYGVRMRATRLQARYQPLLESIPVLAQVAVLALGGWMAIHGEITIGTFLAFSTYVGQFVAPARQLAGVLTVGQQARAGVERIFQLLDLETADRGPARRRRAARAARRDRAPRRPLRLRRAGRCSTGSTSTCEPGERVALVGASGSGKSTVTRLSCTGCSTPTRAQVLVDGHDVRTVTLRSLRGPGRRGVRGELPVLRHHRGQHRLRPAGGDPRGGRGGRPGRRRPRVHPRAPRRLRHHASASAGSACPAASVSASPWLARC